VLSNWLLKEELSNRSSSHRFEQFKNALLSRVRRMHKYTVINLTAYFAVALGLLLGAYYFTGTDIFPETDTGQVQVRLRLPAGTRLERTEEATQKLLQLADSISQQQVQISSAFAGVQPSSYPINMIHLWTSGPQEAVIKINLKPGSGMAVEQFRENLRLAVSKAIPRASLSFEPGELVNQVLNLGASNPVEIAVLGRNFNQTRRVAEQLEKKLSSLAFLRDVQISTPLDYPALKLNIDRIKAGKLGLTVDQVSKSTTAATSSSRFTQPDYWLDKTTGTAYQVQVEYPQYTMNNPEQVELIPLSVNANTPLYLRDVASWEKIYTAGEYDRLNQQRYITITGNIHKQDLNTAIKAVNQIIGDLGALPNGVKIMIKGQADLLAQTKSELQSGLWIAVVMIFMMLAIYFQSFRLPLITLSIVPAVLAGGLLMLLLTNSTLNIQSYIGMIMAVGVAIANAILFITQAERHRRLNEENAFLTALDNRLRPIIMTTLAMIAGMIPMSLGLGEAGDQMAPLGRAVIGGLLFSAISTVIFLPLIYQTWLGNARYKNISMDPDDEHSKYHIHE
jgi:multidrug efflux pump subunit AcrB